jgi:hypothetical protein
MAKTVLGDVKVVLDSYDLGNLVSAITVNVEKELLETTGMGDTFRTRVAGFASWSADITFFDDLADNALNEEIFSWVTGTSTITAAFKAIDGSGISATNPEYQGNCWVQSAPVLSGQVGAVAGGTLRLLGDGALVRDIVA